MPYKRRHKRKYRHKKSSYGMAKLALRKVSQLRQGVELKHLNVNAGINNIDNQGVFSTNLNTPAQGTGDTNRIGDSILIKSWEIRGRAVIGANQVNTKVRLIGIWDKLSTLTSPDQVLNAMGQVVAPESFYTVDTRGDWSKIFDHTYMLTGIERSVQTFSHKFRLNKKTQFDGNTGGINKGRLIILYLCNIDTGDPVQNKPDIVLLSRIRYQDS